jgi:hypothetical protein
MGPLRAKGGVVTVTRMHDRVIVKAVEDLGFQIIHERREVCGTAKPSKLSYQPG